MLTMNCVRWRKQNETIKSSVDKTIELLSLSGERDGANTDLGLTHDHAKKEKKKGDTDGNFVVKLHPRKLKVKGRHRGREKESQRVRKWDEADRDGGGVSLPISLARAHFIM